MNPQLKSTWRPLSPVPARENCNICHGTGWELRPVAGLSGARRCECGSIDRLVKLKQCVRIPSRYQHCTLENFRAETISQIRALSRAREFAQEFPKVSYSLFFSGGPQAGKTHLAVGILRYLLQRFHDDLLFVDFGKLLSSNLPLFQKTETVLDWKRMRSVELLVLDEFEFKFAGLDRTEIVEDLLHARWLARRCTIYTGDMRSLREAQPNDVKNQAPDSPALSERTLKRLLDEVKILSLRALHRV
jgi:DNA replication protein DnaC